MSIKFEDDSKTVINPTENKVLYLVLPYVDDRVEDFKQRLVKLVKGFYPNVTLKVMFKCATTTANLFSFKDRTPKLLNSNIVYRINCKDCQSFYIGKTTRCFIRRLREHEKGKSAEKNISALFKHARSTRHSIDYENATIIDRANNDKKLLLKEMLHINKLRPDLNVQKKSELFRLIIDNN